MLAGSPAIDRGNNAFTALPLDQRGLLTWPEVARAAGEGRVPIVPIGTLEDHGYHLPIDTDVTLVEAVCRGAAEHLPAQTVLTEPLHPYTKSLLAVTPEVGRRRTH